MSQIKLVSLNIERSKHLDLVIPFLEREKPDVACLQEVMEYDVALLEKALGASCFYSPQTRHGAEGKSGLFGPAIFSSLRARHREERYYWGTPDTIFDFDFTNASTKHATENHAVSFCDMEKDGASFRIANTHFTWTPDGQPDDFQREDMTKMLEVLAGMNDFVLCGDFNAPRGGEIFSILAAKYKDNIPSHYTSSLDPNLHRIAKTKPHELEGRMVDGLFSTPAYQISDVRLEFGVSDHAAIVATIEKASESNHQQ